MRPRDSQADLRVSTTVSDVPLLSAEQSVTSTGDQMFGLIRKLYPICRSITGDGVRQTLEVLREHLPLTIHAIPSQTPVLDWTVPKEWNIRDAYIKNAKGVRVVDFLKCNLHVVSYSVPIHKTVSLEELKAHLFTLPEQPDLIPYRTSYYNENWGFCLSHRQLQELQEDQYEVCIDSTLEDGELIYGEYCLEGESDSEVLISTHVCHPSLANDNLSGIALATFLAKAVASGPRRYSYRFLFTPGLIGSIAWLSRNDDRVARVKHGFVLACAGDRGNITYKKSRRGTADIDRAVVQALKDKGAPFDVVDFSPWGYDERQFCSPGFNLPVGCFMRTPHGQFPEYHTSADNLQLVTPECLEDSLIACLAVFGILENDRSYVNQNPKGEPQLGKRGLYSHIGGLAPDAKQGQLAILWVLNLSDGEHSLLDIAERSGISFRLLQDAARLLLEYRLLQLC